MDLFEYQGKQYFARFGIPTSKGDIARSVDDALGVAREVGYPAVLKAQVKVGGRGKAGGVKIASDAEELRADAEAILGMEIKGHVVDLLWVEHASSISEEYYASFTLDRAAKLHLCMVSSRGGVEIEQVAEEHPDAIARLHVDPVDGLGPEDAMDVVTRAGLDRGVTGEAADLLMKLYRCYVEGDAELVEVNPLVLTGERHLHALDAKVTLDDSAAFRHPEWEALEAGRSTDSREAMARERNLNYVGLSGSTGIIANGAGLAMSTVDLVSQVGGSAANFLDVGGGADADVMVAALEVINSDERVRSILVNIFGGIVRCDEVARGILEAMRRVELRCPITIRLDGTNAVEARGILADHLSEKLMAEPTMLGAARRAVEVAGANA